MGVVSDQLSQNQIFQSGGARSTSANRSKLQTIFRRAATSTYNVELEHAGGVDKKYVHKNHLSPKRADQLHAFQVDAKPVERNVRLPTID